MMICLYVDDMIYAGSSQAVIYEFKKIMMDEFEMTGLGNLRFFLGLEIKQEEYGIFLSQQQYAKTLLKRFGMLRCNPVVTPIATNEKLLCNDGEQTENPIAYQSLVGGLIYLTHTRPDIAFAVNTISRYMEKSSTTHFAAAK